jgi:hypothetical protein
MNKVLEEIKKNSFSLIAGIDNFKSVKISKKPTKKKIFDFIIMKVNNNPFIEVYVNKRFFETLYISKGKWVEERKI